MSLQSKLTSMLMLQIAGFINMVLLISIHTLSNVLNLFIKSIEDGFKYSEN